VLTILLLAAVLAPAPAAADSAEPALPPGTLRFFNRDIVTFTGADLGVSPRSRAARAADRLRHALARNGPGTVAMTRTPEGLSVTVDGAYVFKILAPDLDAEDGQTFDAAEAIVGRRLEEAIAASRQSWRAEELVRGLGLSLVATLGLGLILWILLRGRSWIGREADRRVDEWLRLGREDMPGILRILRLIGRVAFAALVALLVEEWLRLVFGFFPYTRPWSEQLTGYIAGIGTEVTMDTVAALPGLGMVVVIVGLATLVVALLRVVARGVEAGRLRIFGIDAEVVRPTRQLLTGAVWLFALAMAYPYLPGSSSDAFKGLSVLVGLMLSLGASGLVGQAAGGFILTFSRTLREGDWVRVGEVEGAVTRVGFVSTKIRTPADEEVSVPNSVLLGTVTRNFSRPAAAPGSLLETAVTIGYGTPWRQIHAMLMEAAARTGELEREPPPQVFQTALSDFYAQYVLRARLLDQRRRPEVLSALNAAIQDVFNEYGVQIMSPHYRFDPAAPVVVPKERWFEPPAASASPPA
jgi:small-conductance mechanosensitive channel